MAEIKHIGRIKSTGRKCLVVFRTLPGDAFNCLVIPTESLTDSYHDALINLVEGNAAQLANEFSEVLARAIFPDGTTMLPSLHTKGLLSKVATDLIEMTPNNQASILLSELNQLIAQQAGVSVQDLAIKSDAASNTEIHEIAKIHDISPTDYTPDTSVNKAVNNTEPLSDDALAKKFRSDADRLSKEAAELRRQAEALMPTKKKVAAQV